MAALRLATLLVVAASIVNSQTKDSSYVGSKACFGCHSAIYKSFTKTGMGRSLTLASDWKPGSLPAQATVPQPGKARTFSVTHNESGWEQTEAEPGVFSVAHQLDFVVGSGSNGLSFLIKRGSYLFQAPLSYYSRAQKWDLSPGYEKVDFGFNRVVPQECINCHAGRPTPLANVSGAYAEAPFQELAIGCENCHGPAGAHVKSLGKAVGSVVNPAKLKAGLADNICLNCHQAGDARVTQPGKTYLDFRPGQWLYDTAIIFKKPAKPGSGQPDLLEHYSAMQSSRCFRESGGKLSCLTCHDPHVEPGKEEAPSYYRPKCLTCHTDESCRFALATRRSQNPPDNCIGCHMPKRDVATISHSALTNHRIPARAGEASISPAQEEKGGLVIVNPPAGRKTEVSPLILLRAYQQLTQGDVEYQRRYLEILDQMAKANPQDSFVQAALGTKALAEDRTEDAVAHLKLALAQPNPAIYLELGQALAKLGRSEDAVEYLQKGVAIDPYNAVMQKTLILQYINQKSYAQARELMQQYVATFPEDPFMRTLLDRVSK